MEGRRGGVTDGGGGGAACFEAGEPWTTTEREGQEKRGAVFAQPRIYIPHILQRAPQKRGSPFSKKVVIGK